MVVNKVDLPGAVGRRDIVIASPIKAVFGIPLVAPAIRGQGLVAISIEGGLKAET